MCVRRRAGPLPAILCPGATAARPGAGRREPWARHRRSGTAPPAAVPGRAIAGDCRPRRRAGAPDFGAFRPCAAAVARLVGYLAFLNSGLEMPDIAGVRARAPWSGPAP